MKTSFFSLKLPWKNRGRRYILRFPLHFYSEVQLAAFFGHFSAFWTKVWIGSFDRIYGRRRRGPGQRKISGQGNVSCMAAFWDSSLVYLPSVPGRLRRIFSPVFFGCVFHFPFSMYVLFKTVLSFFVFFGHPGCSDAQKDQQRHWNWPLAHESPVLMGGLFGTPPVLMVNAKALVDICEQEREKAKQHFQVEVKDRFFGSKIRVLKMWDDILHHFCYILSYMYWRSDEILYRSMMQA